MQVGDFILHGFQDAAVDNTRGEAARVTPRRVVLVAPTGAGKTIIALALIQLAREKQATVGFITSGRQLIFQMRNRLRQCQIEHTVFMDGADNYIGPVSVISKDTLVARWDRVPYVRPRLLIVDEADVCTSEWWQRIMQGCDVVIGLTATPCLANGKGLGGLYAGMVKAATYSQLIESGLLVPVRCFSPYRPDLTGVHITGGDYNAEQLQRRMDQPKLVGDVFREWSNHGENRPTAVFATGVAHSIHIAEIFNGHGVPAAHLDGETPDEDRQRVFAGLRDGSIKVVVSCGVLSRGWDEPCVSCGVIAKPTRRLRSYLQMAGRIIRVFPPNKKDAVLIDHAGCVYRHGWPTEDHDWQLDPGVKIEERELAARRNRQRQPYCCPKCAAMWETGNQCPNCGFKHQRRGQPVTMADGSLKEVKQRTLQREIGDDAVEWKKCLAIAANKNGSVKMAAAIFHGKTGKWPEQARVEPLPTWNQRDMKVAVLFPGFVSRKR